MSKVQSKNRMQFDVSWCPGLLWRGLYVGLMITACCTLPERAFADSHFLDAGIQNFNANQFDASLYEFNRAKTANPNDPVVRYYTGSALVRLNRSDEAFEEFQKAFSLAPANSQIKELARAALATFNGQPPMKKLPDPPIAAHLKSEPKTKPKPALDSLDPDNALLQATGGIPESNPGMGAPGSSKSDRGSISSSGHSTGQSSLVSGKASTGANPADRAEIEAQCADILAEAKKRVEEMNNNVIHGINGDMHIYSGEDTNEVLRKASEKCRALRASLGKTASDKGGGAKPGIVQYR